MLPFDWSCRPLSRVAICQLPFPNGLARPFCFALERAFPFSRSHNTQAAWQCKKNLQKSFLPLRTTSRLLPLQAVAARGSDRKSVKCRALLSTGSPAKICRARGAQFSPGRRFDSRMRQDSARHPGPRHGPHNHPPGRGDSPACGQRHKDGQPGRGGPKRAA